jgi:hypothetical protein
MMMERRWMILNDEGGMDERGMILNDEGGAVR